MRSSFQWTNGKVLYLYFCGGLMGAWLTLLIRAVASGGSIVSPLVGIALALGLTLFPLLRSRTRAGTIAVTQQ